MVEGGGGHGVGHNVDCEQGKLSSYRPREREKRKLLISAHGLKLIIQQKVPSCGWHGTTGYRYWIALMTLNFDSYFEFPVPKGHSVNIRSLNSAVPRCESARITRIRGALDGVVWLAERAWLTDKPQHKPMPECGRWENEARLADPSSETAPRKHAAAECAGLESARWHNNVSMVSSLALD